jgi:hypothetical protein
MRLFPAPLDPRPRTSKPSRQKARGASRPREAASDRRLIVISSAVGASFVLLLTALLVAASLDARASVAALASTMSLMGLLALLGLAAFACFGRSDR